MKADTSRKRCLRTLLHAAAPLALMAVIAGGSTRAQEPSAPPAPGRPAPEEPASPSTETPPKPPPPKYPGIEGKKIELTLSLEDVIRIAIANNLDLAIEEINRNIARRDVIIQRAIFDPQFTTSYLHSDNRDPTVSPLDFNPVNPVIGVRVNPFDVNTFRTGFRGTTILGTTYQITAAESRFNNPQASLFSLNPRYSSRLEVSATQPLLKNAWYGVNSANIRIARNNLLLSKEQFERVAADTILNVVNGYWELFYSHKNYQSKAKALEVAQEQLGNDRLKVQVGTMAQIDLTTSESQVALRKTEFDQAISQLETARDELLRRINYTGKDSLRKLWEDRSERSPFDNILVLPVTEPVTEPVTPDRSTSLQIAFENRSEYRQIDLEIKNQQILVDLARNRLLPSLDLNAAWTQLGLDDKLQGSFDSLGTGKFYDWLVGISLEIPLTYRGPINELRNARDAYQRLVLQKQILENSIVLEVDQAIRNLQFAHRAVENLRQQVALQEMLLRAERTKLEVGRSIFYAVTQIENDLVDTEAQEIRAESDFENAKAAYERAVGTLLPKYGIAVSE